MALKKIKSDDAFREHIEQLKAAHRHPADTVHADEPLPTDETAADETFGLEPSPIMVEMEATSEEILEDSLLEQEADKTSSPAPEDSSYPKQTPI